jgi:hypothetical protein
MPDIGIIQSFTQLPIGVLDTALDSAGPYGPGSHSLTTWSQSGTIRNVNDTFGVVIQVSGAIAPKLGLQPGFDDGGTVVLDTFQLRPVQAVQLFQTRSGVWVPLDVRNIMWLPYLLRWVEDQPGKLGLYVAPTWHVDLYYLITI